MSDSATVSGRHVRRRRTPQVAGPTIAAQTNAVAARSGEAPARGPMPQVRHREGPLATPAEQAARPWPKQGLVVPPLGGCDFRLKPILRAVRRQNSPPTFPQPAGTPPRGQRHGAAVFQTTGIRAEDRIGQQQQPVFAGQNHVPLHNHFLGKFDLQLKVVNVGVTVPANRLPIGDGRQRPALPGDFDPPSAADDDAARGRSDSISQTRSAKSTTNRSSSRFFARRRTASDLSSLWYEPRQIVRRRTRGRYRDSPARAALSLFVVPGCIGLRRNQVHRAILRVGQGRGNRLFSRGLRIVTF